MGKGGGSTGSGANAPHPQDLPDNNTGNLFMALMQFAAPLMAGTDSNATDFRSRLLQLNQGAGGQMGGPLTQDLERQFAFMQALASPELD